MKKNTYLISGILLLLVAVGASGCGSNTAATASTSSSSTGSAASSASQAAQGQSDQQSSDATGGAIASNPALQTVMEMRRLQGSDQMVLTSDQKTKLKPLVQSLIDTSNPTQDFLQQQADAMSALLTDQQKTYLKQAPTGQRPENNTGNPNDGNSNNNQKAGTPNGNSAGNSDSNSNSNQKRPSFEPKDIYQQFLDLLN